VTPPEFTRRICEPAWWWISADLWITPRMARE
jgi:hypothetical protein